MDMKVNIDPPEGYKYGFPKVFDTETDGVMLEWIVDQGYPEAEIDKLGDAFRVRMWAHERQ
jgi:hypothetical protein